MTDSLNWYKIVYDNFKVEGAKDQYKDCFVTGLINFLSQSSSFIPGFANRFPGTFSFDIPRLRSLKSDVVQITSLQLCMTLYRQLVMSLHKGPVSNESMDAMKQELLVLVNDACSGSGTNSTNPAEASTLWANNAENIALQIAKRAYDLPTLAGQELLAAKSASAPNLEYLSSLCMSWLSKHLKPDSTMYAMFEKQLLKDLDVYAKHTLSTLPSKILSIISAISAMTSGNLTSPRPQIGLSAATNDVFWEVSVLVGRVCLLGNFHWKVFSNYYINSCS